MTKEIIYRYLGTNGVLETPIHLEDVYYVRLVRMTADFGKVLTNGTEKVFSKMVPEEEASSWQEVLDEK